MLINNFIKKEGRALPVFILLDVSGSMKGEKIETVNVALKEMIGQKESIGIIMVLLEWLLTNAQKDSFRGKW